MLVIPRRCCFGSCLDHWIDHNSPSCFRLWLVAILEWSLSARRFFASDAVSENEFKIICDAEIVGDDVDLIEDARLILEAAGFGSPRESPPAVRSDVGRRKVVRHFEAETTTTGNDMQSNDHPTPGQTMVNDLSIQ